MKHSVLFLAIALFGASPLFAQASSTTTNLPPGWVDGSKTPSQIPDAIAYRLVFKSLMVPASPSAKDSSRQEALMNRIQLSAADEAVLKQALVAFSASYSSWVQTSGHLDSQAWALVQATRTSLQTQLSPDGNSKLSEYVALAKTHIIANPNIEVSQ